MVGYCCCRPLIQQGVVVVDVDGACSKLGGSLTRIREEITDVIMF